LKDWKSTVAGLLTAFFGFVLFSPEHFQNMPWLIDLAKYGVVGGLASMGIVGRDAGTKD
jgi:hypothetical protein